MMLRKIWLLVGLIWLGVACAAPAVGADADEKDEPNGPLIVTTATEEAVAVARLVDPVTLEDVAGFEPMELGNHYVGALSPLGNAWAVVTYPGYYTYGGELHIVDVANWTPGDTLHEFTSGEMLAFDYTPDGTRLVAVQEIWGQLARGSQVMVFSAASGEELARVEVAMRPDKLHFSEDGQTLFLYGERVSQETGFSNPPQVAAVNLADGALLWTVDLDDVQDGIYAAPELADPQPGDQYGPFAEHHGPGIVFSPDGRWLYVAHTDGDTLTSVDLATGTAQTEHITERMAFFEQLLYLTAQPVYAKGPLSGAEMTSNISPDGSRLYVSGYWADVILLKTGNLTMDDIDSDLTVYPFSVLDATSGERVAEMDTHYPVSVLSPDGSLLALMPFRPEKSGFAYGVVPEDDWTKDYVILDTATLEPVAEMPARGLLYDAQFSRDGSRLYVQWIPPEGGWLLEVVDTQSGQTLATRRIEGWYGSVLMP